MKIEGANIEFLDKYFPEYFSEYDFYDENCEQESKELNIEEIEFSAIKKFTKKYRISDTKLKDISGLLVCCKDLLHFGKLLNWLKAIDRNEELEKFKIVPIIKSKFIEVTIKSEAGQVKIKNTMNLHLIEKSLRGKFVLRAKNSRSYTKQSEERIKLKRVVKILESVFSDDLGLQIKTKQSLYRMIKEFLIIVGYSLEGGRNSISTPEDLIKKILNS